MVCRLNKTCSSVPAPPPKKRKKKKGYPWSNVWNWRVLPYMARTRQCVKDLEMRKWCWIPGWVPNAVTSAFIRQRWRQTWHRRERRQCGLGGGAAMWPQPRNAGSHQKLEQAGDRSLPRASRGSTALSTPWLQPSDTDDRYVVARTTRERISGCSRPPTECVAICHSSPEKLTRVRSTLCLWYCFPTSMEGLEQSHCLHL